MAGRHYKLIVISQFGEITRIDTKTIRTVGRATMGVKLLGPDDADKVAAAVTIPRRKDRGRQAADPVAH